MLFTIQVGEKLDLSKFRKHATHYIGQMREIHYHIYLPDYKVTAELATADNETSHIGYLWIEDIKRDQDNEIIECKMIYPSADTRFKESKDIQSLFPGSYWKSLINSNSVTETVDKICRMVKLVHKINGLRVFL
jgi:hypothetical protein